jgi:predicted Zn-dependent protease
MDKGCFIAAFVLFGLISCASTNVPTMEEVESVQLFEDENRLWNRAYEEQRKLDHSSYIYEDPVLTDYVNNVAQNLVPEDLAKKGLLIQVKIIKNPLLNAFAYPNGVIYIHTGILSKMENEAQLATILGHEMTHVTHRHAIQNYRSVKNTTAILATVQVATVPFGAYGDLATILGTVGTMAAVSGYSRELETEADEEGLNLLVSAGYDPKEAPRIFEHLKKDIEEQDLKEPFFFGTHPRLQERINNYNRFIKARYSTVGGKKAAEIYMQKITPLLLDNARFDIAMGRFGSAQKDIERFLKIDPQNAEAHFSLGELYRQRNQQGDIEKAINEYNLSVNYNPSYPAPHKSLGILYYKQGIKDRSKLAFERYLFLAPDAKERGYIEQYIKDLEEN